MSAIVWARVLFVIAAAYDGVLGVVFMFAPGYPFRLFDVTPPNHMGYVQFPAALLIIFGIMFFNVAREPVRYRGLVPYGVLLKVAYCSVVFYYWATTGIPFIWKPFAVIDCVMLVLFLWAYAALSSVAVKQRAA
jgi:hypothetical protein